MIVRDFVRSGKFNFAEISDEKSETPSDTLKIPNTRGSRPLACYWPEMSD